jgi:hypothetical protein
MGYESKVAMEEEIMTGFVRNMKIELAAAKKMFQIVPSTITRNVRLGVEGSSV